MITKINIKEHTITSYAIRKLTPKECYRLMGVRDTIIRVMQSTTKRLRNVLNTLTGKKEKREVEEPIISASQQYKMAGNSIVVDVLKKIYQQLWFADGQTPTDEKIILTTFSGYDSQLMAAEALKEEHPDFRWTCAGWSDIDKYACQMHDLVFPQFADRALGDITKIDWTAVRDSLQGKEIDLFTYSSPCQDISQAGKQMGLQEGSGTRSALLWNVADAVEVLRPKFLLQENVAALVSKKFLPDFQKWLDKLDELGYVSTYKRLNSKHFGIPQNRDRVFVISMRKDLAFDYHFPEPEELTTTLRDILEDEVDERYFLKDDAVGKFLKANQEPTQALPKGGVSDTTESGDSIVFVQFDLPPKHEDATFLKTWLSLAMDQWNAWQLSPTDIEQKIDNMRPKFQADYNAWRETGTFPGDAFEMEFNRNMERKE